MTLDEAAKLLAAAGIENPRGEARLLLAHVLGMRREDILAALPDMTAEARTGFAAAVTRRAGREPFAYVTGAKQFWSLGLAVGPGVLVPRPDTETLVEEAQRHLPDREAPLRIADLGAGSGALLLAALTQYPNATGVGYESSAAAFAWAQKNATCHAPGRAEIRLEDWNLAQGQFDLILSNPPYIPSNEIETLEPEVARYEPRAALDGGPDGLAAYRTLAGLLPRLLKNGGVAILEIGAGQVVEPLFAGSGLRHLRTVPDLSGIPRALVLEKPRPWGP